MTHHTKGLSEQRPPIQPAREKPEPSIAESFARIGALGRPAQSRACQP